MAKYGVGMTLYTSTPSLKPSWPFPGRQLTFFDYYETAALTNDQVILAHVNKGDRVVGGWVKWDALGSGVTLTAGDQLNCSRLMSTATATFASLSNQLSPGCGYFTLVPEGFEYTADCDLFVWVGSTAATGTISMQVDIIRRAQ